MKAEALPVEAGGIAALPHLQAFNTQHAVPVSGHFETETGRSFRCGPPRLRQPAQRTNHLKVALHPQWTGPRKTPGPSERTRDQVGFVSSPGDAGASGSASNPMGTTSPSGKSPPESEAS